MLTLGTLAETLQDRKALVSDLSLISGGSTHIYGDSLLGGHRRVPPEHSSIWWCLEWTRWKYVALSGCQIGRLSFL
jgi:hypothetical protein